MNEEVLSAGHARALIPLDEGTQINLAKLVIEEGWSVRRLEDYLRNEDQNEVKSIDKSKKKDPHIRLTQQLAQQMSRKVRIKTNSRGGGQILLYFKNPEDLERLKEQLK